MIQAGDTVARKQGKQKGTRGIVEAVDVSRVYVRWETSPKRVTPILIKAIERVKE